MTNNSNEKNNVKVVTNLVILNRANLFCPKSIFANTEPKYYTVAIIPKDDVDTVQKIKTAINNAIENGKRKWGEEFHSDTLKLPFKDGDEETDDIMYQNSYFINASTLYKPGIVNHKKEDVLFADVPNGQHARVSISFHEYNINGNKGVSCKLLNVQLLKGRFNPNDRLSSPQDDFKD